MSTPSEIEPRELWRPALVAAALIFLYATVLGRLFEHWWTDENYSHGLLIPFVVGYIVWSRFGELRAAPRSASPLAGGTVVLLALLMLLGATLGAELFGQRLSLVLMLAGIVMYFFGSRVLRMLSVPFVLLLLAVPVPQIIFNKIAFPLQLYASRIAVGAIRFYGVPTVRKGNVIEILPEGAVQIVSLEVVEACSGIRSLMTLMALALILAYFTRRDATDASAERFSFLRRADFWRGVALVTAAVPIAILTNAGRVAATGVLTYHYGTRAVTGPAHEAAGWLVFIVALLALLGLNLLLLKIFRWGTGDGGSAGTASGETPEVSSSAGRGAVWLLAGTLLAGGLLINWLEHRGEARPARQPLAQLPTELGGWRQQGGPIRFSAATESVLRTSDYVMREYVREGRSANLYVGYYASQRTGATYHSPRNCLPGSGWEMRDPAPVRIETSAGRVFEANRYIVVNGDYRAVMLYWYQGRGRFTASEYLDKIYTVSDSIFRRRSDGALVRIMTPAGDDEAAATKAAVDLAARTADALSGPVPE